MPSSATSPAVAEVNFEEIDPEAVAKQRASLTTTVVQLQKRFPNIVGYESRASADMVLSAAWMGAKFGDNELAALGGLSEWIVTADLSNTAITDRFGERDRGHAASGCTALDAHQDHRCDGAIPGIVRSIGVSEYL